MRTVRYGLVWKKLNEIDAATAVTAPATPATDRRRGDHDQHQDERGVGAAEFRSQRHEQRRHADGEGGEACTDHDRITRLLSM